MDRNHIEKIAKTPEDRMLLAKVWDKITGGMQKNVFACTDFLSPRELEMTRYLFGETQGLISFGGHPEAERKMLVFLPDYLDEAILMEDDSPVVCLRASFYRDDSPTHRDFLGALMGAGITRQSVGDIYVSKTSCDFFVTQKIAPYILQNFSNAGRVSLQLEQIPLAQANLPQPETQQIKDTLASLRLDSVISTGFRISRSAATQFIAAGRVAIGGLPCDKPDKLVEAGVKISVRGLGKILLKTINGQTKKGRISVVIDRYV